MAFWNSRSMWVKKFNLQITLIYIHFSHYANPPKCIVDTVDIWKTLDVFCIYFFGQWFVEIKLKKLSILTCEFMSNFVARYWGKWWLLLVPGTVFDFGKQPSRSAWTMTISSWITPKNLIKGISLTPRSSIDW